MAQQLRTLLVLAKEPGSNPSTHIVANSHCKSSSREPEALFQPPKALHNIGALTYMQVIHSHAHIK